MTHESSTDRHSHGGRPGHRDNGRSRQNYRVDRGRGYKRISDTLIEVYDFDMACWFHMQQVPVSDACKNGRELVVTFYDPVAEEKISDLAVTWLNSEASRFASAQRQLKKVTFATARQR